MVLKVQAFQRAPATMAVQTRAVMPRQQFVRVISAKAQRPASLQSEFLSPVAALKGFAASFSQLVLQPVREAVQRIGTLIEANKKKGKGCTLEGTRRKRARVSGFRARMETPGGRKVLASRRSKGRKVLCPAGKPSRKNQKPPSRGGF